MSELEELVALAEADRWIERVKAQKLQLPEITTLNELEREMKELATTLKDLTESLDPLKKELAEVAKVADTMSERRLELGRRLDSPTATPKELVALGAERQHVAEQFQHAEDRELELMERCEPLEKRLAELSELAKAKVARRQELRDSIAGLTATLDEELSALQESRTGLAHRVPALLLDQYERARAHVGGGVGAVAVVNGRCDGCHIALSPLDIDHLKRSNASSLMACPECGRLLLP